MDTERKLGRVIKIFYVLGALTFLYSFVTPLQILHIPVNHVKTDYIVALLTFVPGVVISFLMFFTAHFLSNREKWKFATVMSMLACLMIPIGTILGIYALSILKSNDLRSLFEDGQKDSDYNVSDAETKPRLTSALLEKRVLAFAVDFIITAAIQALAIFLFIVLPVIHGHIQANEVMLQNMSVLILPGLYLIFRDCLNGRSVGKKIMKLYVADADKDIAKPALWKLIIRNLFIVLWPIEIILLGSGKERLGDQCARTRVLALNSEH